MDIFEFVQKFFLFLLPGIIGTYLYSYLNIYKEQHYYFEFLKMIMLSFASYLLTDFLFGAIKTLFPLFLYGPIDIIHQIGADKAEIPTSNVLTSVVFALIMACILTKAESRNWLFRLANKMKLTHRSDNRTVWEHVFDDNSTIVLRDYVTKNTYYGTVESYSDDNENREIYFNGVHVFDEDSNRLYYAKKLYLSRAHNEFNIEIHNYTYSEEREDNNEHSESQTTA